MLVFIDNFDSFTYNLVQCFQILGIETCVVRDGTKTVEECLSLEPRLVVIGPGPGAPSQALLSKEIVAACEGCIPVLGICLGHQLIAEMYGGIVKRAKMPMHGKTSSIFHSGQGVFKNLPQGYAATRYHSLIVDNLSLPECLEVTAWTETQEIMGLRHRNYSMESVQFHPESILTEHGLILLNNFIVNSYPFIR